LCQEETVEEVEELNFAPAGLQCQGTPLNAKPAACAGGLFAARKNILIKVR
jgi:hypothetical protein